MIKRYCDRCGQQIDEGVHAWYVLELHGTDGEFRHKELCEECYEYLCEKDEAPKADRKTEPQNYCDDCLYTDTCDSKAYFYACTSKATISKMEQVEEPMKTTDYCDICKRDMCEDCVADATNPYCVPSLYEINYEPKDEPQTEVDWKQRLCDMYGANRKSFDEAWEKYEADKVTDEPQTERSE